MFSDRSQFDPDQALVKEELLENKLRALDSAVVAFSGGVDSSYLLYKAVEVIGTDRVLALSIDSELTDAEESAKAGSIAEALNARHRVLKMNLLSDPELKSNFPERCYICKKYIYSKIIRTAKENYLSAVLDGSNADDQDEYRPGMRALKELMVFSPLLEVELKKEEIRYLSRQAGLATWNKPSAACLASRLPYGEEITLEKLKKIAAAEDYLRQIRISNNVRVRYHGNLARIEVDRESFILILRQSEMVVKKLRALGFNYVTLDLEGFRSGSMDRPLG